MFKNLRAEMAREGLSGNAIAKAIEITGRSYSNKMLGNTEFTRKEMFKMQELFFKGSTLEYLFDWDDREPCLEPKKVLIKWL